MDTTTTESVTPPKAEAPVMPIMHPIEPATGDMPATPHHTSWGALIVIFLILAMIVLGAFYAWGQRVAQTQPSVTESTS